MNTPMLSQLEEARAPWNWPRTEDEEKEEEFIYFAENIHTGDITEVTE